MALERIPLSPVPSQILSVQLGQQSCRIAVRQRRTGVYLDLSVQDRPLVQGSKALDRRYLIRAPYMGFTGDLYFADTQGTDDPSYEGLGSRWQLIWDDSAP